MKDTDTKKKTPQNGGNTGAPTTEDRTADLTGESGEALNVTAPQSSMRNNQFKTNRFNTK